MAETGKYVVTTGIAILLAFIGYLFKYVNDLLLAKRKDRLDRLSKQLGDLYGPLYSLLKSNEQAWLSLRTKLEVVEGQFDPQKNATPEQLKVWKHYMKFIFIPTNEKMYEIIISKSDLLIEPQMPDYLLNLVAHIVAYRAVFKNWDNNESTENSAIIPFPNDVRPYIYSSFEKLKKDQIKLLQTQSMLSVFRNRSI